ncbi:30S ribosomal protein S21 [Candidatus Wolfebacteria bacterium CG03_land_8_20_14_0_80_40_12]|uniref:30S ribosomal protein S21 n=1 Tax=Candidatus Wolfebacteria bacterium CG03_land_8_20_14_0_80_40_12 TaxID=1975069 RepID=A0A2M7B5P5_9BACT|nr:MAG: 30S ribosomal protein S21 [Candidatus Wolfebacteria bacterium CG03_land_8_20_14_0_80_40_12]
MEIKRREGEPISAFLYRFSKKIQQSGVLREVKKRRYKDRAVSRLKRRLSALHRERKRKEVQRAKKMGTM